MSCATPAARADRVSCGTVVAAIDAVTIRPGSDRADPVRLAKRLGVEPAWVLHCAEIYGRRVAKSLPPLTEDEREQMQERWESEDNVQVDPEDRVQGPLEVLEERRERRRPPPDPEQQQRMLESDNPPPQ